MKKHALYFLVAALIFIIPELAYTQETVATRADRMIDVVSGEVIRGPVIVVEGDRIVSAGRESVPRGAEVIDLGDMTLLPRFMDMHTHITSQLGGNLALRPVTETAADAALYGVKYAKITLMAGFTTIRNVGLNDFVDVSLMHAIEKGTILGPRIIPAGYSLSITGCHGDVTGYKPGVLEQSFEEGMVDGVDEVIKAARYQIKHGTKVIKINAIAGVLSFEGPVGAQQYSEEEMVAIVDEANRHGIKVAAHAHGTEGIITASRAGIASIEHGSMLNDEEINVLKENGTYLIPTTYLVEALNLDALRTTTVNAVDLLGVDDRGIFVESWLADIVAVPGNPFDNIRVVENVRFVMIGGKIVKQP